MCIWQRLQRDCIEGILEYSRYWIKPCKIPSRNSKCHRQHSTLPPEHRAAERWGDYTSVAQLNVTQSTFRSWQSLILPRSVPPFTEPEGSLTFSQHSATGPYLQPEESSSHSHTLLPSGYFNIILAPSTPWSQKRHLPFSVLWAFIVPPMHVHPPSAMLLADNVRSYQSTS
jgi:hypothetical protein